MVQSRAGVRGAQAVPRPQRRRRPQVSAVVVSVRLTASEAAFMDASRGAQSRADWMRSRAMDPTTVLMAPERS